MNQRRNPNLAQDGGIVKVTRSDFTATLQGQLCKWLVIAVIVMIASCVSLLYRSESISLATYVMIPQFGNRNETHSYFVDFNTFNMSKIYQHLNYFSFIEFNSSNRRLIFCNQNRLKNAAIGNYLETYWVARSLAFWTHSTFEIKKSCQAAQSNHFIDHFATMIVPKYYDNQYNKISNKTWHNWYNHIENWLIQSRKIRMCQDWPIECNIFFAWYNEHFISTIQCETNDAMNKFFNLQNQSMDLNLKISNLYNDVTSDIVIHIRCGDVLSIGSKNVGYEYGFLTSKYYQLILNATNWKNKLNENSRIWILSQLSKSSLRNRERNTINKCSQLVESFVETSLNKVFYPGKVIIVRNGTIETDFLRMMYAPMTICPTSTFCLLAGAAHKSINNDDDSFVVSPMIGPWTNDTNTIAHLWDNNTYDGHIWQKSSLIPKHQIWINVNATQTTFFISSKEAKKEGWINNISQFVSQLAK